MRLPQQLRVGILTQESVGEKSRLLKSGREQKADSLGAELKVCLNTSGPL